MLDTALALLAALVAMPIVVLAIECAAALWPRRRRDVEASRKARPRLAVLVPAHNESATIEPTLSGLARDLQPDDILLVVADNCTDDTADVARRAGAAVVERHDELRRGKGYALAAGVETLAAARPDVVIVVDADCTVAEGALELLARRANATGRPVQASYRMYAPELAGGRDVVSEFAVTVKNHVRPLGLARLGLPCQLTGSGMAFPWTVLEATDLASGDIVEDMKLGYDLLLSGKGVVFCGEAQVTSPLPSGRAAADTQRTRWEHGHLHTSLTQLPRLLRAAVAGRRAELWMAAADLAIPPLSLLVMTWCAIAATSVAVGLWSGVWLASWISAASGALFASAILVAVSRFRRKEIPLGSLWVVPWYVVTKGPRFLAFLWRRQTAWVRTTRDTEVIVGREQTPTS